ncbi:leukotriene B4 receptor 1-like [Carassius carassius]|uniref:leukotriene B4 receptor 1-like n=1 Tax=Carassius carassius TaxID=217509 RepID=UPI002868FFC8|nr:leukotriene B4 receptor 1-like [Carassius carassius]
MLTHGDSSLNSTSWTTADLFSSGLMGLCFLVGIPGNIAVIIFIVRHFKKDNFTVHLMLNLAAADILCLITLPVWIYSDLESIDQVTCKFFMALVYCSAYSSVITVTMLSLYRCLRIRHPHSQLWTMMSKRRERALLISTWALALLFSCPGVLTQEISQRESRMECERNLESDARSIIALLESLLGFFLPFTIMLTSYYFLYKTATQGAFRHRTTKLVTRIVIVFFIFWAPYEIIKLEKICSFFLGSKPVPSSARHFAGTFTFINSCVDPFLYAFSSKSLHKRKQPKEPMVTKGSQHLPKDHSILHSSEQLTS